MHALPAFAPPLARLRDEIEPLVKSALRLVPATSRSGRTWLGGRPLAPPGAGWPCSPNGPLWFVGQIDLEEVHEAGAPLLLPKHGLLQLFYDFDAMPTGHSPADRAFWSLRFGAEPRGAFPGAPPAGCDELAQRLLRPELELTLPAIGDLEIPPSILAQDAAWCAFWDLQAEMTRGRGPAHRLGGNGAWEQDDPRPEAELVSLGHDCSDGPPTPLPDDVYEASTDWTLLWQIDGDDEAGLRWGESGKLYLLARTADLARGDFSQVQLALQCG